MCFKIYMEGLLLLLLSLFGAARSAYTEKDAVAFLKEYNAKSQVLWSKVSYASWDFKIDQTDENNDKLKVANDAYDAYQLQVYPEILKYPWRTFSDPLVKRQFKFLMHLDEAALPEAEKTRLSDVINQMTGNYSSMKIKDYHNQSGKPTLYIEDLEAKLAATSDACEMTYYWDGWHTQAGRSIKSLYPEYVKLENKVAVLNKFTDAKARIQDRYEIKNMDRVMGQLLQDFRPLFQQLHAYIRRQLWLSYGKNHKLIDLKGPIPASLLGNIFGLDGINIFKRTAPYPSVASVDVTPELIAQNYTGLKMAKTAEKFYTSLGLREMTEDFWKYSIFEKPAKKDNIDCSDMAFNFFNGKDYRITLCSVPSMDDFGRFHHEMGHIKNYMKWAELPFTLQDASNPGFNEALGDMMYLYATGPTHLKRVGLLGSDFKITKEQQINALYLQALSIVFFLPYAYSLDQWRWKVYQGEITPDNYNCEYWKIRLDAQGVEPPVDRDENDFDPGAKYHVAANLEYMVYFISGILEFQMHNSLCITAGQYDPNNSTSSPVYLCDIFGSTAAGEKLKSMMSVGKSAPWYVALERITGTTTMDASVLVDYFRPLYEWLQQENRKTKEKIGWESKRKRCYSKGEKKPKSKDRCRYTST